LRHRGPDKGRIVETGKYPLRHLARFILIGLYTGTRAGAIASASTVRGEGKSFVDLDARLLAHMRRWHRQGIAKEHFGRGRIGDQFEAKSETKTERCFGHSIGQPF
jgi:hypothetical protein